MISKMRKWMKRAGREEKGVTAIEYALLAALIAVTIIVTVTNLGLEINTTFETVESSMETANTPPP